MQPQKAQTIDLQMTYPCPCGRQGRLSPIALTEAFGCDYCQQIFVAEQAGLRLAQLASHAPESPTWFWTGQQWCLDRKLFNRRYVVLGVTLLAFSLLLMLLAWNYSPGGARLLLRLLAVMVLISSALLGAWLASRH